MKLRNSGRWMFACHHEAGHILTYWYFGYPVDWAVVLTVAEIRAGIEIKNANGDLLKAKGLVQANDVCRLPFGPVKTPDQPEIYKFFHLDREKLRDIELINLTAGMKAESIHRRISINFVHLGVVVLIYSEQMRSFADGTQIKLIITAWNVWPSVVQRLSFALRAVRQPSQAYHALYT